MAVTFNVEQSAEATGVSTLTTASFTIASGTNLAGAIGIYTATGKSVTSSSVGGISASAVTNTSYTTPNTDVTVLWGVTGLSAGSATATVNISASDTIGFGVIVCNNVDQSTPLINGTNLGDVGQAGNTFGTTGSLIVTSTNGNLTTTIGGSGSFGTISTNQSNQWTAGVDSAGDTGPGTGTTTHTWTFQNNSWIGISGADFKATAVATPAQLIGAFTQAANSPGWSSTYV